MADLSTIRMFAFLVSIFQVACGDVVNRRTDPNAPDGSSSSSEDLDRLDGASATSQFSSSNCDLSEVVTFETFPDGTEVTRGSKIKDQYEEAYGLKFYTEKNGLLPVIADVGSPGEAYSCSSSDCSGYDDGVRPNQGIGKYFMTFPASKKSDSAQELHTLFIEYSVPANQASGYILDIDGEEDWQVIALDLNEKEVGRWETRAIDYADSALDGMATQFTIDTGNVTFSKLAISNIDAKTAFVAFDNFSPSKICNR